MGSDNKLDLDAIVSAFIKCADKEWKGGLTTRFAVNGLVVLGKTLVSRVRELEAEKARLTTVNHGLKQRFDDMKVASLNSSVDPQQSAGVECGTLEKAALSMVRLLADDNAALRLAATELYEFVAHDCEVNAEYGVVARMASVLGIKTKADEEK